MASLNQMAKDLGQALARTDEYQTLKRAIASADDDRELVELRNKVMELEEDLEGLMRRGKEPDEELVQRYEDAMGRLQGAPGYQRLVAAQTNFQKVVARVNDTIAEGIQEGAQSRIVLPS